MEVKQKIRFFLVFLIICLTVTSCWSRRELNELAIVVGLGIDKVGDQYQVSLQMVNPSEVAYQGGGTGRTPVLLYKEKGKSIFEAIRRITTETPRKAFFSHLQIVVLSEEVAKEGIKKPLEFFWRDHEFRSDFYIIVARKTRADKVLDILTALERVPSRKLFNSLENSEKYWAPSRAVTMDRLIRKLISDGIAPMLTGVTIEGNPKKGAEKENTENVSRAVSLKYTGIAVFKESRLVGWLDELESKGSNYILDQVNSTVGVIPCPGSKANISVDVVRVETKVTGKIQDGKPVIYIDQISNESIGEAQCKNLDLTKPATIARLEEIAQKRLTQILRKTIHAAQKKYKSDFLGFGEAIHRADPQFWKKIKKNWEQEFVKLPVRININVNIHHTGKVSNSFIKEMKTENE